MVGLFCQLAMHLPTLRAHAAKHKIVILSLLLLVHTVVVHTVVAVVEVSLRNAI